MNLAVRIIIVAAVSYLFGNINFAVIISRFRHGDIRKSGSGNPGTMNVVRTYGKVVGALCLILDAFKAAVPAFFGSSRERRTPSTTNSVFTSPGWRPSSVIYGRCS